MSDGGLGHVLVAGAAGMVGSAICRALAAEEVTFLPLTREQADFRDRVAVDRVLAPHPHSALVIAAARVGGIHANDHFPAEFIYDNLMIEANLIDAAYRAGIRRVLFLGSSCIYPREAKQPMAEEVLLTDTLEPTNEPYAIAKIAGIKLCESYNRQYGTDYRSLMPTNLYGEGDNFHPLNSHVIPGLIDRFHKAKVAGKERIEVWGTGRPRREFLHVDDLASATLHVLKLKTETYWNIAAPRCSHLNVGTGTDITIAKLAELIRETVGLNAELYFNTEQPDGTLRKRLSVDRLQTLGWAPKVTLKDGLARAYRWYLDEVAGC